MAAQDHAVGCLAAKLRGHLHGIDMHSIRFVQAESGHVGYSETAGNIVFQCLKRADFEADVERQLQPMASTTLSLVTSKAVVVQKTFEAIEYCTCGGSVEL